MTVAREEAGGGMDVRSRCPYWSASFHTVGAMFSAETGAAVVGGASLVGPDSPRR